MEIHTSALNASMFLQGSPSSCKPTRLFQAFLVLVIQTHRYHNCIVSHDYNVNWLIFVLFHNNLSPLCWLNLLKSYIYQFYEQYTSDFTNNFKYIANFMFIMKYYWTGCFYSILMMVVPEMSWELIIYHCQGRTEIASENSQQQEAVHKRLLSWKEWCSRNLFQWDWVNFSSPNYHN